MSSQTLALAADCAQEAQRTAGTWVGMLKPAQTLSGPVSDLAAEPLAQLRQLTACYCGNPDDMHSTHCLAEYREDVEALAALLEVIGGLK